jgi:hypothetical protein
LIGYADHTRFKSTSFFLEFFMKTELEIVQDVVAPGNKVKVVNRPFRNYLLHQIAVPAAQMILGIIESDSANSSSQNSPRETRNLWNAFSLIELERANGQAFRDAPHAVHELEHVLLTPHANEIMTIGNIKCQRLAYQLNNFIQVIAGLDSNKMQTHISDADFEAIDELIAQMKKVMTDYWGTGVKEGETFDNGLVAPEYAYGQVIPDFDRNAVLVHEPSSSMAAPAIPDVPDAPSIAPNPGTLQS